MQANEGSGDVPLQKTMKQLYDAASSEPWRPGPHPVRKPMPISLTSSSHSEPIQRALDRACRKSFVHAVKPLRRLFRNQGAVNDSVIEACSRLFARSQEMMEEMSQLQQRMSVLEARLRDLQPEPDRPDTTSAAQ